MNTTESSKGWIIAGIGIAIIVFGVAWFMYQESKEKKEYTLDELLQLAAEGKLDEKIGFAHNGFPFVFIDGLWITNVKIGDDIVQPRLHFSPRQLDNVTLAGNLDERFYKRQMYLTLDPLSQQQQYLGVAGAELGANLYKGLNITVYVACQQNDSSCGERPIVNCDSTNEPVLQLEIKEKPRIIFAGNCIKIQGNEWDIVRAVDRLLYKWYRIMQ
jgi:hypothetical protein